jgi:hypothetical protein
MTSGRRIDAGDRRDVADEVEGELVLDRGVDGVVVQHQQERVAVGLGLGDAVAGNAAAGARLVLDHEGPAELLGQPLADQSGDDVGRAARAIALDDVDRPRGPSLWPSRPRQRRQRGSARCEQQRSARRSHGALRAKKTTTQRDNSAIYEDRRRSRQGAPTE